MTPIELIRMQIAKIDEHLGDKSQKLPYLLKEIRESLQQDDETVSLLTEEEIGIIVKGMSQAANIAVGKSLVKKTKASDLKNISIDSL